MSHALPDRTDPHREQRAGGRYEQARGEREREKCTETEAAAEGAMGSEALLEALTVATGRWHSWGRCSHARKRCLGRTTRAGR